MVPSQVRETRLKLASAPSGGPPSRSSHLLPFFFDRHPLRRLCHHHLHRVPLPPFFQLALSSGPHSGDACAESPLSCRIMALDLQPPDGRKRVKVYELRNNDWFDRGTGFCTGTIMGVSSDFFVPACAASVATATTRARAVSSVFRPPPPRASATCR